MIRFQYTCNYPKLINDMLTYLYHNRLIDVDIVDVLRLGYFIDPKLHPLAWEICADAWCDVWNNDTPIVQALANAIWDWDCK